MACIAKRRGKWVVDYYLGGRRSTPSFGTKGEAERFLRELRLRPIDARLGFIQIQETTLSKAINDYLELVTKLKAERTAEVDTLALNELSLEFPKKTVTEISVQDMARYQGLMLQKFQASTVNRKLTTIRHFFKKCLEWKYTSSDPTQSLRRVAEPPGERTVLAPEQIRLMIDSVPSWAKDPLILVSMTGVRRSEAISLQWNRVDFSRRSVTFFSKKGGVHRRKDIPMTSDVFEMLMSRWNQRQTLLSKSDYVFTGFDGKPINPRTFSSAVSKSGRKCGVNDAGIQILRRTLLTDLAEFNQSGSVLQMVAGHSSLTTTQKYIRHGESAMRSALDLVQEARSKAAQSEG